MRPIRLKPTRADRAIAHVIEAHADPPIEAVTRVVTYGADERLLLAAASAAWIYSAWKPRLRPVATHFFAVSIASAILPHLLKRRIDQTRPDRLTVRGHLRGAPFSGSADDAFPSGHAVHMGALAAAAGLLPKRSREAFRLTAVALSASRIVLLAHWASDVVAGFAAGFVLERALRPLTLPARARRKAKRR